MDGSAGYFANASARLRRDLLEWRCGHRCVCPTQLSIGLDTVYSALADSTRREVLRQLTLGPASVSELAQPFDMALPSFVQHLTVLERSGLIRSSKTGRVRTCELIPETLLAAEQWISERRALWEHRVDALTTYVENKHARDAYEQSKSKSKTKKGNRDD